MKLLNIHHIPQERGAGPANLNMVNVGDYWCSPVYYFDFLKGARQVDIKKWHANRKQFSSYNAIIVGGGGNFHYPHIISSLYKSKQTKAIKKLILWGAGHNTHGVQTIELPRHLKNWDLVGSRDYNHGYPWVPCVSCMHTGFDEPIKPQHDIIAYEHKDIPFLSKIGSPQIPALTNAGMDIKNVLNFLSSGRTILTNTYHGVFWSTLLGRKVIIVEPFSSRFYGLKHRHVMCTRHNWEQKITEAINYPRALEECRKVNINFSRLVEKELAG